MGDSTASMWIRMLGLEELWTTANSPGFQQQIGALVAAVLETRIRVERIEYKLDALLDRLDPDGTINRRNIPALSQDAGVSRDGESAGDTAGPSASGVAADARGGERSATLGPDGECIIGFSGGPPLTNGQPERVE